MLDYEWGNPSTIMFTGNEDAAAASAASVAAAAQDSDQAHHQMFDHYGLLPEHLISPPQHEHTPATATAADFSLHHQFSPQQTHHQHHQQQQHIHNSFFDPRAFAGASAYPAPQQPPSSMLSLDPFPGTVNDGHRLLLVPKSEDVGRPIEFTTSRIGLNLGGRTYFSSEDDFVSRLYRRARPAEPGLATSSNSPRCQAEGCNADLSHAKHYHRRHKVCEFHSKAATVIAAGLTQRFCQQCSRLCIS